MRLRVFPILLAVTLFGLVPLAPAQATFTRTASATVATTSAKLQPALAVLLPGTNPICFGTITVTWTPSISFVAGAVTGFTPANFSYTVTLKSTGFAQAKTVNGGGSATVTFTGITLLDYFSATVVVNYQGWTSTPTDSTVSRGCLI